MSEMVLLVDAPETNPTLRIYTLRVPNFSSDA